MPEISVIVPVYNVEDYLEDCLESILNQSFCDYEIVCINDGSIDNSGRVIEKMLKLYPDKFVYIKQENRGLSVARNCGLSNATGKYVCFVDSDDILVDGALAIFHTYIKTYPDVQVFNYETSQLLFQNGIEDKSKKEYYKIKKQYYGICTGSELLTSMIENSDYVESANLLLINRSWLMSNNISFAPDALYEDSIFSIDCFLKCEMMLHINKGLYVYRIRDNSIMTSNTTFKQFKWRVWQYREVLKRIFTAKNDLESNALSDYARLIVRNIKNMYYELSELDREKISDLMGVDRLLTDTMGLNEDSILNYGLELNGLIKRIEDADSILIYGAGNVGIKIYKLIEYIGLEKKIRGFAVTDESSVKMLYDVPVMKIEDYYRENLGLVIISSIKYHHEMMLEVEKLNYSIHNAINVQLENQIDDYLKKGESERI